MGTSDFFIGFELTRHCNLRCKHCLRRDLHKVAELPKDFVAKILDQTAPYGKPHIAITGGEPTLHTQFTEIIQMIVDRDFTFHFVSNGYNFEDTWRKIGHLAGGRHWDGLSFSIDGATEATHDAIRGRDSYRRVTAAAALCKIKGVSVTFQMVVQRQNRHEMRQMAELASAMKIDRLYFAHMQPTVRGLQTDLLLSPQEWGEIDREILELKRDFRIPIQQSAGFYDMQPLSHCKFLRNGALNIDYRGRLTVCCQLSNTGEDGDREMDVVCDLNEVALIDGHRRLVDVYNGIHQDRLAKMGGGSFSKMDHYHCWHCHKRFGKMGWLAREYPDNPWVTEDPEMAAKVGKEVDKANQTSGKPSSGKRVHDANL